MIHKNKTVFFVCIIFSIITYLNAFKTNATQTIRDRQIFDKRLSTPSQKKQLPIFRYFPSLIPAIPHVTLADLPTPIDRLKNIEIITGAKNIFIKRDDKTSNLFGGNKVRKLEFLLGEAIYGGAEVVLTRGCTGSNHATATALHAHKLNLKTILYFLHQKPTSYLQRNLLLNMHAQAQMLTFSTPAQIDAAIAQTSREIARMSNKPSYYIPGGGSNNVGILGFINAALELKDQINQGLLPEPDLIYVSLGSCGTAAGLIIGLKLAELKTKVVSVLVLPEKNTGDKQALIKKLCSDTIEYLTSIDQTFSSITINDNDIFIRNEQIGDGYAIPSKNTSNAIKMLKEQELITLDGTYSGKAFAALLHDLKTNDIKDKKILFWNTFFAENCASITKQIDYKILPKELHHYFVEPLSQYDEGLA